MAEQQKIVVKVQIDEDRLSEAIEKALTKWEDKLIDAMEHEGDKKAQSEDTFWQPLGQYVVETPQLTPEQQALMDQLMKPVAYDGNETEQAELRHPEFDGGGVREAQGDRPRFELLVPEGVPYEEQILTRFAVHMAKGAKKYTQYGECACGANTSTNQSIRRDSVGRATSETSGCATPSSHNVSATTTNDGSLDRATSNASERATESVHESRTLRGTPTGSRPRNTRPTSNNPVEFVDEGRDTWTTTTPAVSAGVESASGVAYVTDATSDSDSTKAGSSDTNVRHLPGCPALQVARKGERNWEQFSDKEALERAKSSAFRHLMQWLAGVDDGEDHAAAILFNVMCGEHVQAKLNARKPLPPYDARPW